MCRIAGIVSPSKPLAELQRRVAAMCRSLRHGGPDDEGIYVNEEASLVLGHRRLSLLDLSAAGHQPMLSACGRYVVSYNGEIYNYPELKRELAALGYPFSTGSDTEVILAAFAQWGTASFARFNGMFAFALYDTAAETLYLVRDAAGIKPLYYALKDGSLAFASEVRAFRHLPELCEDDPRWPVYLMAYGHLPEPVTTLKAVSPLKKGSFLRFQTRTGCCKTEIYSHFSYFEKDAERPQVLQNIRETLRAAVSRHLLSDAPIGVFLSGGIDSSLMALLAGEAAGSQLNTLSIYFSEQGFSEKEYQDLVLQKLPARHHPYRLTEEDFHRHLPEVIGSMDLPSCDGINTWFITKKAKEAGLKAVLSGLGGDELFGGYPSFSRMPLTERLQGLPSVALRGSRLSGSRKAGRLAYLQLPGTKGLYLFLRGQAVPRAIAQALGLSEAEVWEILQQQPVLPDIHQLTPGNKASWLEFNLYMQNQLLRDSDVMSMAHGVEIRVPFLDKEVVKLAFGLSSATKYRGLSGKQLLIEAFAGLLPEGVWKRKKMGFAFPFQQWMQEDEWIKSRMMSGNKASRGLLKQFEQGGLHWSGLLTSLLIQEHAHAKQDTLLNA